jgi:D-inositol-3-phosphate glycosyltransferase
LASERGTPIAPFVESIPGSDKNMRADGLKIAFISVHALHGAEAVGVERSGGRVMAQARALARAGHRVDLLCRRDDPQASAINFPFPGVRCMLIDAGPAEPLTESELLRHVPAFAAEAERLLRHNGRYDTVHANRMLAGLVAQRLKESLGLPFVMNFHAIGAAGQQLQIVDEAFEQRRIDIERRIVRHADRLIAECPQQREDLIHGYGASAEQIELIPAGVDTDLFSPPPWAGPDARPADKRRARVRVGVRDEEFVLLYVGRLVARKGIDNVIRAMGRLGSAMRTRLLIVGAEGGADPAYETSEVAAESETARLQALAHQCGVSAQVSFLGARAQHRLPELYACADVLVSTPWTEPFGSAALEAMACALPVVASDVGGLSFTVVDGVTGFLVRPRDPIGLAGRLEQLYNDPSLRRLLGQAGVQRARSMFRWERVARQLGAVHEAARDAARAGSRPAWFAAILGQPDTLDRASAENDTDRDVADEGSVPVALSVGVFPSTSVRGTHLQAASR